MPTLKRDLTMEQQLARGPMDLPFLMLVLMLTVIGVIAVFSASYATALDEGRSATYYFIRQAIFAGMGVAVMYFASKINYQNYRWMSVFVLGLALVLLVLVAWLGRDILSPSGAVEATPAPPPLVPPPPTPAAQGAAWTTAAIRVPARSRSASTSSSNP